MKKILFFLVLCLMVAMPRLLAGQGTYSPNQLIIDFSDDITPQQLTNYLDQINGIIIDQTDNGRFLVEVTFPIEFTDEGGNEIIYYDIVDIIEGGVGNSEIDDFDLNYEIYSTPLNLGELLESLPIDIYSPIPEYVDDYPGSLSCPILQKQKIKLGIIDTGIDPNHSFITDYIVYEANVYNNNLNAIDDNGHGTNVAGIIAGLAQSAEITPEYLEIYIIKALDQDGKGTLFNATKAVEIANGLDLDAINISWGVPYEKIELLPNDVGSINLNLDNPTSILMNAFGEDPSRIIICGAGNNGEQISQWQLNGFNYGPADFTKLINKITVGATIENGELASFSNYGNEIVNICAPGTGILAPTLNGYWVLNHSGTSFSAAIVSGVFAQYWIQHSPDYDVITGGVDLTISNQSTQNYLALLDEQPNEQSNMGGIILNMMLNNAYLIEGLTGLISTGGIIDVSSICSSNDGSQLIQPNPGIEALFDNFKKKKSIKFSLEVFPNPSSNYFYVNLSGLNKGTAVLELLNFQGGKIFDKELLIEGNDILVTKRINLSSLELPKGIYFLKIKQSDEWIGKKIIRN